MSGNIYISGESSNNKISISGSGEKKDIDLSTKETNNNLATQNNNAKYYSDKALEGAEKAKQSAEEAKQSAQLAQDSASSILNDEGFIAVSQNFEPINTVANSIDDVSYVANNAEKIEQIVEDLNNIGDTININIVATNIDTVNTTANNINSVNDVADSINSVNDVADSINSVNDVAYNLTEVLNSKIYSENAKESETRALNYADNASISSDLAQEWAVSSNLVENIDYSSKHYAEVSKAQADIATSKTNEVVESANNALENIEANSTNAITEITELSDSSKQEISSLTTSTLSSITSLSNNTKNEISTLKTDALEEITNTKNIAIKLYDSATVYMEDDWVLGEIEDEKSLFKSLTDNNIGNPLDDVEYWEAVKLGGGSSYSFFDIVMKDHVLTYEEKQGLEPLGSYVYKTALAGSRYGYPDFYAKCVDEYNNSTDATFKKYKSSNVINNFGCIDKEGVLSKFNAQQTCQMSGFLVGNGLELVINFTTDSADIATAQTIFGAKTVYDGMYIQIYNSKLRVYVSSNGTSWNVANAKVGTYTFLLGHEYCVRYRNSVTGNHVFSIYDGVNWTDDITIESSTFVWGEYHNFGIDAAGSYPFLGTIDLNKSYMIDLGGNGKYNWNGCNYYEFAYKEHSNGHKFYDVSDTTAVEAINELYSKYGLAWLYGIDTTNERVCLPRNDYLTSYVDNVQQAHGNGIVLALTDGTNYSGLNHRNTGDYNYLTGRPDIYGMPVRTKSTASYNLTNQLGLGLTDDPEKSGIVVDIKNTPNGLYAYMVVGNTTTEGATTEAVEVTTSENDTVPLFTGQYFDFSPNNVSWLKAGGQANSGGIYTTCYQELVNVLNGETKYGDLKVIDTANMVAGVDYSLYWKVDQAAMTFVCPTAISSKSYKDVASVVGNGISIGITDGTTDTGLRMGAYSTFYGLTPSAELYGAPLGSTGATTQYTLNSNIGLTTDGTKSGIEAHLVENTEAQLYFKVANAVENLELLDAGGVLETLTSKVDLDLANCTKPYVIEVSDKSLLPSWYRVYSDGWCEQGGQSSVATATTTITLLKSYVGTNYSLSMTGSAGYPFITSRSTGSFVADTSAAATVDWVAKGYIN